MEHEVQGWKSRALVPSSVDFPNTSFQSVAYNRRTHFARHGDTQTWVFQFVCDEMQSGERSVPAATASVAVLEIGTAADLLLRCEPFFHRTDCRSGPKSPLNAQALSALGASAAENSAALPGAHAQPESMGLLPSSVIRLECSLHGSTSF